LFDDLKPKLLHDQVAAHLREIIVRGELAPGTPVDELALCAQFGISRTPLREALKVLAVEELVELRPRQGAVISSITTRSLAERFDFVILIEVAAARLACDLDTAVVEGLDQITARMRDAIASGDRVGHSRGNESFHHALVRALGNDVVLRTHEVLLSYLRRSRYYAGSRTDQRDAFLAQHGRIVAAIRRRDADAAEKAVRDHLTRVRDHVLAVLRDGNGG
jgi:DNA-binding GntR family transcriptional regulator